MEKSTKKFGRLIVTGFSDNLTHRTKLKAICVCGNNTEVSVGCLKNGYTKSCGCLQKDVARKIRTIHGKTGTRLHRIWNGMRQRCQNKNSQSYEYYGARGIKLCQQWQKFSTFEKWALENGYQDNLSIDRINNNKGYYPKNCRWATPSTQSKNQSSTIWYNGECASEASRRLGGKNNLVVQRLRKGWSLEKAFTLKKQR